jgi:Na+-transporting NADH:ubiquinone oxidoreductase subunit B
MAVVVMAVMPALLFGMWNVGYQHYLSIGQEASIMEAFFFGFLKVLTIIIVSYVVGLGIEFGFAQWRGHEVNEGFLVTGMLIPLIVPVDTPLWMIAVATAFSVVIGKEVFGGTGMNIWNPALLTRAFLFFAYPSKMSGDKVWIAGLLDGGDKVVDGFSGATPLGQAITGQVNVSLWDSFTGTIPGSIGETSTLAILIGAVILLYTGVGSWKIMLSTFAGGYLMALVFHAIGTTTLMQIDPVMQLTLGGFAFGAVFMATDPVTATRTEKGKWIYGFLIGVFAIMIRVFNPAYPEGVMLAILLMNTFAPLIDHFVVQGNIKRRLKRAKVAA